MKNYYILISFFIIICSSCIINNENDNKYYRIETQTQGKDLNIISELVEDSLISVNKLILLVANGDCGNCINNGFQIFKLIEKKCNIPSLVISAGLNSGYIQKRYSYEGYVYQDFSDLIRKKLLFCYTPILLSLDDSNQVTKALVLNSDNLSIKKKKEFINHLN